MAVTLPLTALLSTITSRGGGTSRFLPPSIALARMIATKKDDADMEDAFPDPERTVHNIFSGLNSRDTRRKQKLREWEINSVEDFAPKPLWWSETPITFSRRDH